MRGVIVDVVRVVGGPVLGLTGRNALLVIAIAQERAAELKDGTSATFILDDVMKEPPAKPSTSS